MKRLLEIKKGGSKNRKIRSCESDNPHGRDKFAYWLNAYSLIFPDCLILQGEMNFRDESSPSRKIVHYIHVSGGFLFFAIQSCPTLCDPMDYKLHGLLQARILEWAAIPFSSRWILYSLSHLGSPRTLE